MKWLVNSIYLICLGIVSCADPVSKDTIVQTEHESISPQELDTTVTSFKNGPFNVISIDSIQTPSKIIKKTLSSFEKGFKIEQKLQIDLSSKTIEEWKRGMINSVNDTSKKNYEIHFDYLQDNQTFTTYILEIKQ